MADILMDSGDSHLKLARREPADSHLGGRLADNTADVFATPDPASLGMLR